PAEARPAVAPLQSDEAPAEQPAAAPEAPKPDKPWLIAAQQARARRAAQAAGTAAPAASEAPAEPVKTTATAAPDVEPSVVADAVQKAAAIPTVAPAPLDYRSPGSEPLPPRGSRPIEPLPEMTRLESLAEQILQELRRHREHDPADFSVTKLLAGIMQMIALAAMFLAYARGRGETLQIYLLVGIFLQTLTIALLI